MTEAVAALMSAFRQGDRAAVDRLAQSILAGEPEQPDALHIQALLALQKGDARQGLALMRRSVAGSGADNPDYVGNFARMLSHHGDPAEAEPWLRRARAVRPESADLLHRHAESLCALSRSSEARPLLLRVLELDPNHLGAANRMGVLAQEAGRLDEARGWFQRAIKASPGAQAAWFNLGDTLLDLHRPMEAEAAFRRALRIDPGFVPAHVHLAYALLMRGAFREGFREYMQRWNDPVPRPLALVGTPPGARWRGEPLADKVLLLFGEQGFGDTLQFVRYAGALAGCGARILLVCQEELSDLLSGADGIHEVVKPADLPDRQIDFHAALMDLPHILDTTLDTIPAPVPYVHAPAERVAAWKERLGSFPGPTVAFAWRSHPRQPTSPFKSCPLAALAAVLELPDVRFVSVQTPLDSRDPPLPPHVLHLGGELRDFSDTAAILANVDHVVTIDTALAHLAGAMGRPTSLLLCTSADWRWFLDRTDCPWYPTVRLFRQGAPGGWDDVVKTVAVELRHLPQAQSGRS